ncbi:MAG: GPW/gp25 family protein [Nitrospirae bacterium]|nr:GPW/gp25 family protein [Nitrospirota bacterium]
MSFYKGVAFNFVLGGAGLFTKKTDDELIKDSVKQIISIGVGGRVMRRDFGCDVNKYVFENMGAFLNDVIADSVASALRSFEPRVTVNNVTKKSITSSSIVDVVVDYTYNGKPDRAKVTMENKQ